MAATGHAVDDDSRHRNAAAVTGEPLEERGGGCGLSAGVDDEQHGKGEAFGERGCRPGAAVAAVEQPHRAFADYEVDIARGAAVAGGERRRTHGPGVEVAAGAPGRGGVKGGVDIVRPRLERPDAHALGAQTAQQAERDRGLAATGGGRGDDQSRSHSPSAAAPAGAVPSGSGSSARPRRAPSQSSPARSRTVSPTTTMAGGRTVAAASAQAPSVVSTTF